MTNLIGHSLGRYHILEQLDQGGITTVYKAYDTRLERDVAVKVLRTDRFASADLQHILKRFEPEARALARLTHPNIVPVIDYGEHEGVPYLVMPYLPGGTLKQRLGKSIPWPEALRLLLPIARALDYAHQHNILHRGVKPSNILFTEQGEPMLTDFGIAKILDLEDGQPLTATSVGVGDPEYMSPEQGLGKPVDARTDVYSLGVVLYEMITGRKPFTADTPMAVVLMQATEPLPRPTQFVPDLPEGVEKLLLKALAKDPADRYASMAEFAAAMERALVGADREPQTADRPPSTADREPQTADRLPSAVSRPPSTADRRPQTADSRPSTVDRRPSTVHRPPSKLWLLIALLGLFLIGVFGWGLWQQQLQQAQATATAQARIIRPENASNLTTLRTLEGHTAPVRSVAFSPDGQTLASAGSYDKTVRLWRVADGALIRTLEGHTGWVRSVAFSPDGQTLASGSWDNTVRLWRVADGALIRTLEGHTEPVVSVAFSPDGQTLASGSRDKTVRLWRVADGTLIRTLEGHTREVNSVAFSPDGQTLASGSEDRTVRLWRVADGTLLHTLKGHPWSVSSVTFSPDGQTLASGSLGTVLLWRVTDGTLLRTLEGGI